MKEITLYNFAGKGDVINSTCLPKLIKNKKDIFIRICCRESDKIFFQTNPYIDEIICIDNCLADRCKYYSNNSKKLGLFNNEINTWAPANNKDFDQFFPWGAAFGINKVFNEEIISYNDCLFPELFYSDKEYELLEKYKDPYVIIETECFSRQYWDYHLIIDNIIKNINTSIKLYTSSIRNENLIKFPFLSLNNLNLRQIGLLLNNCKCFFGINSRITVVSTERTINRHTKRMLHSCDPIHKKYLDYFNIKQMQHGRYIEEVVNEINSYN